jgi:FkbH-like protein
MYESEVNNRLEAIEALPPSVVKRFGELREYVKARTILPWGEHCTECSWPTCYTTCELYEARSDGNCRLFADGMVRVDIRDDVRPYLLKLRFKRWGKLWTVGNLALYETKEVVRKEKQNILVGALTRVVPLPHQLKSRVLGKVSYLRRCAAENAPAPRELPDCFVLECYNPNARPICLTISIRAREGAADRSFQQVVQVTPGFLRECVPAKDIFRRVDPGQPFEVEIVPNEVDDTVLYFGMMDFARLLPQAKWAEFGEDATKPWKCIVWDLDNTLWQGTLIEDGQDRLKLRHDLVEVIKETDRRGILHSIASKNNHADAIQVLQVWGIDKYFLYPQINWDPKSQSIEKIARLLNIGVESLAFVDDQPFEREEVLSALPKVTVVDTADAGGILSRPECQVPITEESQQRRVMYQQEKERKVVQESFEGDYTKFLQECRIELALTKLTGENLERVYELAQRTNQMNFSGSRYPREQLAELQQSKDHETFVIRCTDRFGSYGIVGFALVDVREPRLLDLMFSCRIQGKRVEHAFLAYILDKYSRPERRDFFANYRKTEKNEKPGKVFEEIGFECVDERDGLLSLKYPPTRSILQENIIRIHGDE